MRGRILFNGNHSSVSGLLDTIGPFVRGAAGGAPPRVLLVTAAWGPGEFGEGGVRAALNAAGVPSLWRGGFDQNIRNLCAWHAWKGWLGRHPEVAPLAAAAAEVEAATRDLYVEKTHFYAARIRRHCAAARRRVPGFSLGRLATAPRDPVVPEAVRDPGVLFGRALVRELQGDLGDLILHDDRMLAALGEAESWLPARAGLRFDADWLAERARLTELILSSDVIFLFGGEPGELLGALRFFDLGPVLREQLRRGATFVSISAGSLTLCERMIIYNDFNPDPDKREFRLFDRGLGLVGGLQLLPHCMDRIHTDDPDNLAYLARRFSAQLCAGLNEESFLLVDFAAGVARSVGKGDGVYVFGRDGVKRRYDAGEVVPMHFDGAVE